MTKAVSKDKFEAILEIVEGLPEDAAIDDIFIGLGGKTPRRTLQYRLAKLVEQERLEISGGGRGRRYRLPGANLQIDSAKQGVTSDEVTLETYIPISDESRDIKTAVQAPIHHRQPVGYNRKFLDNYRPNETFYLSEDDRKRLLKIGKSPNEKRPAGTYVREIYNRLLIDLSWNSSRLEGNTYTLLETKALLELGESAEGKNAKDAQMILNHKVAIELLVEQSGELDFTRHTILSIHALLSDNLLEDSAACGRLRSRVVEISGSVFLPQSVPQVIEECFKQILETATAITDPFEQAFFVMVHLPYLQPFEDVNKRVSRLALNIPFIRGNLSPLSFIDVPEKAYVDGLLGVYELNRIELLRDVFVWAYERSCKRYSAVSQSLGEPNPFRLRYRTEIFEAVGKVVRDEMERKTAVSFLGQFSEEKIPTEDQLHFIEMAETELISLHEGNIARYKIRPSQYTAWIERWK